MLSRRLSLWGLTEGKRGALPALANGTLRRFSERGHLQFPCFTDCVRCPEHQFLSSEWVCFPTKQNVLGIVCPPQMIIFLPTSSACSITAADIACSK